MRDTTNPNDYQMHHASLASMVRWIKATPRKWSASESVTNKPSSDWDLKTGYEGALKLAETGWQAGTERMAQAIASLPSLESTHRTSWGVAGGSFSVGRYCSGNPMCMRTRKREFSHKPAITLAVNVCASAMTDAQYMSNYGLAVARYCDELEQAGYPVEVVAVSMSKQNGGRASHSWTVKEQGQSINLADMAFSIAHPACFRRLGFAAWERVGNDCWGYGACVDIEAGDLPQQYSDAILLNGLRTARHHSKTPESAVEALRETVNAILEEREAIYH